MISIVDIEAYRIINNLVLIFLNEFLICFIAPNFFNLVQFSNITVKALIQAGADVNHQNHNDQTSLMWGIL